MRPTTAVPWRRTAATDLVAQLDRMHAQHACAAIGAHCERCGAFACCAFGLQSAADLRRASRLGAAHRRQRSTTDGLTQLLARTMGRTAESRTETAQRRRQRSRRQRLPTDRR